MEMPRVSVVGKHPLRARIGHESEVHFGDKPLASQRISVLAYVEARGEISRYAGTVLRTG